MQEEIHILFPEQLHSMEEGKITFTINHMKCRTVAVMYYLFHAYDYDENEILIEGNPFHIGSRWVIDETWSSYHDSFEVTKDALEDIFKIKIELVLINVDNDNPCYFTELMLQNGEFENYHHVNEDLVEANIEFINNAYVNLYPSIDGSYLQIIRPNRTYFTTNTLSKSSLTVLAPHLPEEPSTDKPSNIFVEFAYQTEQTTNIKPI